MKRLLAYLVIVLGLGVMTNVNAKSYGEGEVQLSKRTVENFITYLRGKGAKKPLKFYITLDGSGATYWYCGGNNCSDQNAAVELKHCEKRFGKKCKLFAKGKFIKWKNGINPGKGKISRINKKWTDTEIFEKFKELGFYNNNLQVSTETDQDNLALASSKSLLEQLEDLSKLFENGYLTEEEFANAKKKVLD